MDDNFDVQIRRQGFFTQAHAFDKDEIVDLSITHVARAAEQGIVAAGNQFQVSSFKFQVPVSLHCMLHLPESFKRGNKLEIRNLKLVSKFWLICRGIVLLRTEGSSAKCKLEI